MERVELGEGAGAAALADGGVATPTLISPPESKTPPTATHQRNKSVNIHDRNSEPVEASVLSKALEQLEKGGRTRERTPTASPSRKRPRTMYYGDR